MAEDMHTSPPYHPGDRVAIATDAAKATVGADHGVVVGATAGRSPADEAKVVVALDAPQATNAVISPTDLAPDPPRP